ncbi:MAG: Flagellar protein FlgJ [Gemmatimonadetes bacterium]|jgi:flagellar protein FlgJ|nr:Flagellar protein FlgJ [Gemmatimonadota bacterium]
MNGIGSTPPVLPGAAPLSPAEAKLKKTALQLEGVFVQRMFAAMRDTVPDGGIAAPSSAESTFTGMLDEKMAEKVPAQWDGQHSLAQALYHQLRQRLGSQATAPTTGSEPR